MTNRQLVSNGNSMKELSALAEGRFGSQFP